MCINFYGGSSQSLYAETPEQVTLEENTNSDMECASRIARMSLFSDKKNGTSVVSMCSIKIHVIEIKAEVK